MRNSNDLEIKLESPDSLRLFEDSEVDHYIDNDFNIEYIVLNRILKDSTAFERFKNYGLTAMDFTVKETIDLWNCIEEASKYAITNNIIIDKYPSDKKDDAKKLLVRITEIKYTEQELDYAFKKLKENSLRRELIKHANKLRMNAEDEYKDIKKSYEEALSELLGRECFDQESHEYDSTASLLAFEEKIKEGLDGKTIQGVKTGIDTLDNNIGCFYYGVTNIIVGRPGHGKTTLMCNTFLNNILDNKKPIYITLELSAADIMAKILSAYTKIPIEHINNPRVLNTEQKALLSRKMNELRLKEFYIIDRNSLTSGQIYTILKKYSQKGSQICYVDYMQLLKTDDNQIPSDAGQFRKIYKSLREVIRKVNQVNKMALVMAVQPSRSVDSRKGNDKIPVMSDLEWSSSIEQDAGLVMGLLNKDKYHDETSRFKNTLYVGVSKNRFGKTTRFMLSYFEEYQYITNFNPSNEIK